MPSGSGIPLPASDAMKMELEKLLGSWAEVSVERFGEAQPGRGIVTTISIPIQDKSVAMPGDLARSNETVWTRHLPRQTPEDALTTRGAFRVSIDPSKEPKQLVMSSPPHGRLPALGIYKLEGDSLIVCFSPSQQPEHRPTEFMTGTNDGRDAILQIYKRAKP